MKITVIGFFGDGVTPISDGQGVKTVNFFSAAEKYYGKENVIKVNTYNWKKHPFGLFFSIFKSVKMSDAVVMLPAQNGVKVFSKLLTTLFKNKKLFYNVIGGWLPSLTENDSNLKNTLSKFSGIWVETNSMKDALLLQGFNNINVVPNFKNIKPLELCDASTSISSPLKLCTFSRVMREKGIELAVDAVKEINEKYNKTVFTLDIYGAVDNTYKDFFSQYVKTFPDYVCYKGVADSEKSVEILKDYYFMLFPTCFFEEGYAGTVIDAMCAAIPVIASEWKYGKEMITNGENGFLFPLGIKDALVERLDYIYNNKENAVAMKPVCLEYAKKYSAEAVFKKIADLIGDGGETI